MSTALQTRPANAPPSVISQDLDAVIRRAVCAIEGSPSKTVIYSDCAPTPAESERLRKRSIELHKALDVGCAEEQVVAMVTTILLTKGSRTTDEAEKRLILKAHLMALRGFPEWAIAEACRRFNDGRAGDLRWAPTPAEFAEEARHIAHPFQKERLDIKRILAAEVRSVRSQAERDRVDALFGRTLDDMERSGQVTKRRRATA